MKFDDLEKTKDLFDIAEDDVPSPIDDIDSEGISKENLSDDLTFGLSGEDAVEGQKEDTLLDSEDKALIDNKKKKKEKKPRRKFKEVWASWSKKKKILVIVGAVLVLLLIVGLILFLVLRDTEEEEKPEEPEVIVEMDNYIYRDGTLIFLNSDGDEIGTYECMNKSEELCFVPNYSDEDNFDGEKNVYEDETLIERPSKIYQDNYVFVFDNEDAEDENIILYNIEEAKEEDTYTLVKGFSDSDFVILQDTNNKYGALEFNNDGYDEVFEFSYDYLGRMNSEASIVARTSDRYYIYDTQGKNLSQGIRYEIKSYNDKYIVVNNNGYYVYDYDGNLIFDDAYDYIELLDDYAVLIDRGLLYIRDYNNNKYNEVGVEVGSQYYNPLNVYSEDKVFIETRRAYEITVSDGMIDVTYTQDNRDRTQSIDLADGTMSMNYKYISYFDGVLYFYRDEEKTDELGSYKCTNQNASDLTNCTIATDSFYSKNGIEEDKSGSVGWIPIYNSRFVFILDTIDLNNPTIVLYDLETSKTLARYATVDSGAYTGKKEVSFVNTDATYVMAQVKSDNEYGLIRISDNVSGTIGFDYASIEKLRDYYLVGTSTGTYKLVSNVGVDVTKKEYGQRIVDYVGTHLVAGKENEYYVYDFEGNRLWEDEGAYKYVALYDNYYVVVTSNNHLNIHKYDSDVYTLSETIEISGSDYANAFSVTATNGGFRVVITSTNTTYTYDSSGLVQVSG